MGYFKFGSDGKDVNTTLENSFVSNRETISKHVGGELGILGDDIASTGFLGNGTVTSTSYFSDTTPKGTNWKSANISSVYGGCVLAIKTDGTLWSWGDNTSGQLGIGSVAKKSTPVQVGALTTWKSVSAYNSVVAVRTDGTLWVWGDNGFSQLGDGTSISKSSPVQIAGGGNNWKYGMVGQSSGMAIKTDGTLWSWCGNAGNASILGVGKSGFTSQLSPTQIAGTWKTFSIGGTHAAGIKTDGTLWLWGLNSSGQLGNNSVAEVSTPVQTVAGGNNWKQVVAIAGSTLALKNDGTIWAWGSNNEGQLGRNNSGDKFSSPVQIYYSGKEWAHIYQPHFNTYTMAARKLDGTIYYWGQTGITALTTRTRPFPLITTGVGDDDKIVDICTTVGGITRIAVQK